MIQNWDGGGALGFVVTEHRNRGPRFRRPYFPTVRPCPGLAHRGHRLLPHGAAEASLCSLLHRRLPQTSLDHPRDRSSQRDLGQPASQERGQGYADEGIDVKFVIATVTRSTWRTSTRSFGPRVPRSSRPRSGPRAPMPMPSASFGRSGPDRGDLGVGCGVERHRPSHPARSEPRCARGW